MAAISRVPQSRPSKPLASSVVATPPPKRHGSVPLLKSLKGNLVKSPSTSSSDSSSGKKDRISRIRPISNRKGTEDTPADARPSSSSESIDKTTSTELEASNELSLDSIQPDETTQIMDVAEPSSSSPEKAKLHLNDLDLVHSNLDVSLFDIDDHEFGGYFMVPPTASSEEYSPLLAAEAAVARISSIIDSINPASVNEFQGPTATVYNTPLEDNISHDHKTVVEGFNLHTLDSTKCSQGNNNLDYNYKDGSTSLVMSEGKSGVTLTSENLVRQRGHAVDAFRGWWAMKILLPACLFVLFTVMMCVDILTQDERDMLPPPT